MGVSPCNKPSSEEPIGICLLLCAVKDVFTLHVLTCTCLTVTCVREWDKQKLLVKGLLRSTGVVIFRCFCDGLHQVCVCEIYMCVCI